MLLSRPGKPNKEKDEPVLQTLRKWAEVMPKKTIKAGSLCPGSLNQARNVFSNPGVIIQQRKIMTGKDEVYG